MTEAEAGAQFDVAFYELLHIIEDLPEEEAEKVRETVADRLLALIAE